jgi:pimeloyl-ACP methyl ester carboxylesterase
MPYLQSGGIKLYYEETGSGTPLVFVHEFSGDHRSWEPQVRHFARRYRCVTFDARGYPPSDVPTDPEAYSQDFAVADLLAVLDALDIDRAHLVGLSMGGFTALHFGRRHPDKVRSLAIGAVGYGTAHDDRWKADVESLASFYADDPEGAARSHGSAPGRIPFMLKDPRGWQEFADHLREHPSTGSANTMRGVQGRRPNLYDLRDELAMMNSPLLVICGDEDDQCLEPSLFLKRVIATAALAVLPRTGHTINLEEPAQFNRLIQDFVTAVDAGTWAPRDPRSSPGSNPLGHK